VGWLRAEWHFLTHDDILQPNKWMEWNSTVLWTKQVIYYLFITLIDNFSTVVSFASNTFSPSYKLSKKRVLICGRNFVPNIILQLLYCVWTITVYVFFQVSPYGEIWDCQVRRNCRLCDISETRNYPTEEIAKQFHKASSNVYWMSILLAVEIIGK